MPPKALWQHATRISRAKGIGAGATTVSVRRCRSSWTEMRDVLQGDTRIQLAPDLACDIDSTIEVTNTPDYQAITSCGAVQYCFDAAPAKRHENAWPGLTKFGPFNRQHVSEAYPPDISCRLPEPEAPARSASSSGPFAMAYNRNRIRPSPRDSRERSVSSILSLSPGVIPKCGHAALRLDCFLVDVCVMSSSSSSIFQLRKTLRWCPCASPSPVPRHRFPRLFHDLFPAP